MKKWVLYSSDKKVLGVFSSEGALVEQLDRLKKPYMLTTTTAIRLSKHTSTSVPTQFYASALDENKIYT